MQVHETEGGRLSSHAASSRFFLCQEAEAEMDKASTLDPLSLIINEARGEIRYFARDPSAAIQLCSHAQELDPNFAETYVCLGKAYGWDNFPRPTQASSAPWICQTAVLAH